MLSPNCHWTLHIAAMTRSTQLPWRAAHSYHKVQHTAAIWRSTQLPRPDRPALALRMLRIAAPDACTSGPGPIKNKTLNPNCSPTFAHLALVLSRTRRSIQIAAQHSRTWPWPWRSKSTTQKSTMGPKLGKASRSCGARKRWGLVPISCYLWRMNKRQTYGFVSATVTAGPISCYLWRLNKRQTYGFVSATVTAGPISCYLWRLNKR